MDASLLRGLERILVVGIGGLAVWFGFLLFRLIPHGNDASGHIVFPGGIKVYVSRVGPGVFFCLFGATVVGLSLTYPVSFERTDIAGPTSVSQVRSTGFGGVTAAGQLDDEALMLSRLRVRKEIGYLNHLIATVRPTLTPSEQQAFDVNIRQTKEDLIAGVWGKWEGNPAVLRDWTLAGAKRPPPTEVAAAAELFLFGEE
jgi:hypothetical protein